MSDMRAGRYVVVLEAHLEWAIPLCSTHMFMMGTWMVHGLKERLFVNDSGAVACKQPELSAMLLLTATAGYG